MKCVVINLKRAQKRRDQIVRQFENLSIQFELFTGIDGHELSEFDLIQHVDYQLGTINLEHPNIPGMLGCWLSHRQVWQIALEEELEMIAVFEDDVILDPKLQPALDILETELNNLPSFDIIFFDDRRPHRSFVPLVQLSDEFAIGLVRHSNIGAGGYVIRKNAMLQLLNDYSRMPFAIDQLMHADWLSKLQIFTMRPQVVFHGERFVDHGSYIVSSKEKRRTWRQVLLNLIEFSIPKRVSYYKRANGFRNM